MSPDPIIRVFFLLAFYFSNIHVCYAIDMLQPSEKMLANETLVSANQTFELGFFSPGSSGKVYVGIWYKNISVRKFVWVANREAPLSVSDVSASLELDDRGNLKLLDGNKNSVWSNNNTVLSNKTEVVLLDTGNFVMRDSVSGGLLWQSFDFPSDTFLTGMLIGLDSTTGDKQFVSSWKLEDDPSPGNFVYGISSERPPQAFIWKGSIPYWRSGQWNGVKFIGIPDMNSVYLNGFDITYGAQPGTQYLNFETYNSSIITIGALSSNGSLSLINWIDEDKEWKDRWVAIKGSCDYYGVCGPYGICNENKSPKCRCFEGFEPKSPEEWRNGNWTNGCQRRTELLCERNKRDDPLEQPKADIFVTLRRTKLPDFSQLVNIGLDAENCQKACASNCSCAACAYVPGIGCNIWSSEFIDTQEFSNEGGEDLMFRLAYSEIAKDNYRAKVIWGLTVGGFSLILILAILTYCCYRRSIMYQRGKRNKSLEDRELFSWDDTEQENTNGNLNEPGAAPMFEFKTITDATNNFSPMNKLGQGGFGPVYQGKLRNGQDIAVKRLSRSSGQGIEEFRNEVMLISKLQHRNLVRILGYCIEGEEKLLIYEYMRNKSLDRLLFDSTKRSQLDWGKRFNIIMGIAKGLLYLHRDSSLRIIHRDLKVSNILLDDNINPKISDFGLARTFHTTQDMENTRRIAGTLGYMSPEYAMRGIFSEKSDVFSFGILVLEIVTGKKNTSSDYIEDHLNLLGYAWQLWNEGRISELIDSVMASSVSISEVGMCVHVGLLCVQDNPSDRPAMPAVVQMLSAETDCPQPKEPSFTFQIPRDNISPTPQTINNLTLSVINGR